MGNLENIVARVRRLWPIWLIYLLLVGLVLLGVFYESDEGLLIANWFIFFLAPFTFLYCIPFGMGVGIWAQARVWYLPKYGHRFILVCAGLMALSMGIAWMPSIFLNYDLIYVMAFIWPILCSALTMRIGMYFVRQREYEESMREIESGIYDYDELDSDKKASEQEEPLEEVMPEPTPKQSSNPSFPVERNPEQGVPKTTAKGGYPVGDDSETVQFSASSMPALHMQPQGADELMSPKAKTTTPEHAEPLEEFVPPPPNPAPLSKNVERTKASTSPKIVYASELSPAPLSPGPEVEPVPSAEEAGLIFIIPSTYQETDN